jgi:hypothetical protein
MARRLPDGEEDRVRVEPKVRPRILISSIVEGLEFARVRAADAHIHIVRQRRYRGGDDDVITGATPLRIREALQYARGRIRVNGRVVQVAIDLTDNDVDTTDRRIIAVRIRSYGVSEPDRDLDVGARNHANLPTDLCLGLTGGGRMTETGLSLGTPYYMSPEQATGDRILDARSDVYSLGTVLYEMLTGEPPFQGTTAQAVLGKILTSYVRPPTETRKSLPPHINAVVMKALERLPADRFESAGAFATALGDRGFRHGEAAGTAGATNAGFWRPLALVTSTATVLLLGLLAVTARDSGPAAEPLRLSIPVPEKYPLLTPDAGSSVQISEDGSTVANDSIAALDFETRQITALARGVVASYSPTGHIVFGTSEGQLMAAPFDVKKLTLEGPALPILEGVRTGNNGESEFSLASNGSMVYRAGSGTRARELVWVDRTGALERIDSTFAANISEPSVSRDGTRVAFTRISNGRADTWTKRLDQRNAVPQRLTFEAEGNQLRRPAWSPDGPTVYYVADEGSAATIMSRRADGTGQSVEVLTADGVVLNDVTISPDGAWMVVRHGAKPSARDIYRYRITEDGVEASGIPVAATRFDEKSAAVSPDGRWIAYVSDQGGRSDVYVRPFPDSDSGVWRITSNGATEPAWSPDGSEIYYRNSTRTMMAAALTFSDGVTVVDDHELFDVVGLQEDATHVAYSVHSGTGRLLAIWETVDETAPLVWIENFFTEIMRRFDVSGGR